MATILSDIREIVRTIMLLCYAPCAAVPLLRTKLAHLEYHPHSVSIEGHKFESDPQNRDARTAHRRIISDQCDLSDLLHIEWWRS